MRFGVHLLGAVDAWTKRTSKRLCPAFWAALPLFAVSATVSAQIQVVGVPATGSVKFPATAVGSSVTQTVRMTTLANATLSGFTVPQSLGGKQEFIVGMVTGCATDGQTVNPQGTTCSVPITFSPAYPGVRSLPLALVTSSGNQNIGLSGAGTGPLAVVSPGTATYPDLSQISLGSYSNATNQVVVDGVGNAYASLAKGGVVKIDATTGAATTVANFFGAAGVALDAAGDLFIGDNENYQIRELVAATGATYTVVGQSSTGGFSGDGGPALAAEVCAPNGATFDGAGNFYFADTCNQRIRRVDAVTQIITTVAGSGSVYAPGYSGDGGLATQAHLSGPSGVVSDSAGNLYIADTGNSCIRRVDGVTGIISTFAGNGTAGFAGDGSTATSAELNGPTGVALDAAGSLYLADANNSRVRKVDVATGTIFTVAGNGTVVGGPVASRSASLGIGNVQGVAIDPQGQIYTSGYSGYTSGQVVKISASGSVLFPSQTVVNTLDATDDPVSVVLSNDGNAALTVTVPSSGTNPVISVDWLLDASSPCAAIGVGGRAQSIAAGGRCMYGLDFEPPTTGALTGTMTFADTSLGVASTQSATLAGTGGLASDTTTTLGFSYIPNFPSTEIGPTYLNYDSIDTLSATVAHTSANSTAGINGTVTFYDGGTALSGGANVSVSGGVASFPLASHLLAPGNHSFTAIFTPGNSSGVTGSSTASSLTESVAPGIPVINLSIDNHLYDGNPHGVTVTTVPENLPYTLCFTPYGSYTCSNSPPTAPGTYQITYLVSTIDYYAHATVSFLHIYPLSATVSLNTVQVAYDGNPHMASATTSPSGLNVTLYYNGSTTPPTTVGRYLVTGLVNSTGYAGAGYGVMEIYSSQTATSTWIVNQDSTVSHLSAAGNVLTTAGPAVGTGTRGGVAIDSAGDAWAVTNANNSVVEVSPSGTLIGTYNGGGVSAPAAVAVDGAGMVWIVNSTNSLTALSNSGGPVSPSTGYLSATPYDPSAFSTPSSLAIDATGSVWIANSGNSTITRVFGAAAPVVTPTVLGVASSTLGAKP
jgi:sugar lactone lactonase YvrE